MYQLVIQIIMDKNKKLLIEHVSFNFIFSSFYQPKKNLIFPYFHYPLKYIYFAMLVNNFTQKEYKSSHVIVPACEDIGALLLGDLNAVTDLQIINKFNIKTIITAASGLENLKIPSDLTHIVFPIVDTKQENISAYFEISYRTIQENLKKGGVLVHCGAGISRSASLIIAYYMKKYNQNFKAALSHVKKIKPNVCPNLGFELQLKNYQQSLNIHTQKSLMEKKKYSLNKNSVKISSPYQFEIPISIKNQKGLKDYTKNRNHIFNKTYTEQFHKKSLNIDSQFLIQGKSAQNQKFEETKYLSTYDPDKYMRKRPKAERNSYSAARK